MHRSVLLAKHQALCGVDEPDQPHSEPIASRDLGLRQHLLSTMQNFKCLEIPSKPLQAPRAARRCLERCTPSAKGRSAAARS